MNRFIQKMYELHFYMRIAYSMNLREADGTQVSGTGAKDLWLWRTPVYSKKM